MDKIQLIKQAITKAANNESKLTDEILQLPSFSSAKIKHLLNNLGAISSRFLEIGLHKAGTFIAALYDNECLGVGVDNWSQFQENGAAKQLAYQYCRDYLDELKYGIREMDCFTMTGKDFPITGFDMYSYDGEHSFENQYKGIQYFLPYLADEFILTVDDTNWEAPRIATLKAIEDLGLRILFREHLTDGKDNGEWHNGFDVFLLMKSEWERGGSGDYK